MATWLKVNDPDSVNRYVKLDSIDEVRSTMSGQWQVRLPGHFADWLTVHDTSEGILEWAKMIEALGTSDAV